jgi:pyruvate formate lyase activating enzyme
LKTRIGFLDGVVICGGEPTLQSDLPDFCRKIKEL